MNFRDKIKPFHFIEDDNGTVSLCLYVEDYVDKDEILFATREDEGFEGNGHDWGAIAWVLIEENMSILKNDIHFNSESNMFCAFSSNIEGLKAFAIAFKEACENDLVLVDLFSKSKIDWYKDL